MARISSKMLSIILEGEKNPEQVRFLQIREEMRKALDTGKYPIRVDVTWAYDSDYSGMPQEATTELMDRFEDAVIPALEKNNLALVAYQLTGEGERLWCFYTRNLPAFQDTLNDFTTDLPLLPLSFYAEEDREGDAFAEVEALL